jgi:uncharacterized protein (TIGR02145 family)
MNKMFFLALTLIVLSAASVNAQVTIGSDSDPHSGAVLDLQATNLGLKLPTVSIADLAIFGFPLEGTSTLLNAVGMVVYNTNATTGAGIYVWNGSWQRISPCYGAPATPGTIVFSARGVAQGTTLTASFQAILGATYYSWILPAGLSAPSLTTLEPAITITGVTTGTYTGSEIKVYAANACGYSTARVGSGSIYVTDCTTAPATPGTISFNYRTVDLGHTTITASVTGVANTTSYAWQLPAGLLAPSLTTTIPSLRISGETVGNYSASDIKVTALNCAKAGGTRSGAGDPIVVADNPNWGTVVGASGTVYTTYDLGEYGIWMTDNSMEGNYTATTYPGHEPGERGYYYAWTLAHSDANGPCPDGWSLPSWDDVVAVLGPGNAQLIANRARLASPSVLNGRFTHSGQAWSGWDVNNFFWLDQQVAHNDGWYVSAQVGEDSALGAGSSGVDLNTPDWHFYTLSGVRCIKK